MTEDLLYKAAQNLRRLSHKIELPGYHHNYNRRYIAYLLGVSEFSKIDDEYSTEPNYNKMKEILICEYGHVLEALCGANGLTVLQMLIAKKGLKDDHT